TLAATSTATPTPTSTGTATPTSTPTTVPDQAPTAIDDVVTVDEDSGATAINVLANDTDPDGGPKIIASVTQPPNGVVTITGLGTGLTYTPNANFFNSCVVGRSDLDTEPVV